MTTTEGSGSGRRRLSPSFRVRVLGLVALILAVSVAVGLFVQRAVLIERHENQVEESLDQERRELESLAAGRDPETGERFGGDVVAIFDTFLRRNVPATNEVYLAIVDGEPFRVTRAPVRLDADRALVARWAALTEGERGWVSTNAGRLRYLAVPLRFEGRTRGVFVVGHFVQPERDDIDGATRVEALAALAVLVVAIGGAWLVAGRLLKPVRDLTVSARAMSESDLSGRIDIEGDDEIAELGRTFNAMLDRLEGAFAAQGRFVAVAGHELRTPITVIRGHLELMGDDPEDRRAAVAVATEELDRMARIVDDLLLLAKAEQPDFLRIEPTELADLTSELLAKARHLGDREWVLDRSGEGELQVDPQRITQAALNLARNAVEHSAPGGQIGIGSDRVGDRVRIWVRDHGTGIEPDDQSRIFDRFVRGGTGARRSEGAGLGLAIVRTIVEAHGGRVDLVSAPGAGSTFTLVLPAPSAGTETPPRAAGSDDPTIVQPVPIETRRTSWPGS